MQNDPENVLLDVIRQMIVSDDPRLALKGRIGQAVIPMVIAEIYRKDDELVKPSEVLQILVEGFALGASLMVRALKKENASEEDFNKVCCYVSEGFHRALHRMNDSMASEEIWRKLGK